MDNPDQQLAEVHKFISSLVEHEVGHAIDDPHHINRTVGEAMRHIGGMLFSQSTGYLPIRPEEILCQPERVDAEDGSAVLLTRRVLVAKQSFYVLGIGSTSEGNHRAFSIYAYQPDEFDLNQTKFLALPPPIGNEVIRQLANVVKNDGVVLLCCTIVPDYFKPAEEQPAVPPQTPPQDTTQARVEDVAEAPGVLPAVNHDLL
jgi:hypothetical protein